MGLKTRPLLWWAAVGSLAVILIKVLLAGTSVHLGEHSVTFGTIDGGVIAAVLTPTLLSLVAHGHDKLKDKDGDGKPDPG